MASPDPFALIASGRIHIAGGLPTTIPDVPVSIVFLVFYMVGAAGNMTLFLRYNKRLRWSAALFGYCMSRITTLVLRVAWSQRLSNKGLAIASLVFLNAGVLLVFLINLHMSKKTIFRSHYAYFKANPSKKVLVKKAFAAVSFLLLPFLAITITGAVQGFLTSDGSIQGIDTKLKRVGVTAFFIYCCLPFPILAANAYYRLKSQHPYTETEKPDLGRDVVHWEHNSTVWKNSAIILTSATLLVFEYAIKLAQGYGNARIDKWYYTKGAFYATSLLPELLAMFILLAANMPKRYGGLAIMIAEQKVEDNLEAEAHKNPTK